jgi:DNA repair exonuclease SbcCD ATPase subunit
MTAALQKKVRELETTLTTVRQKLKAETKMTDTIPALTYKITNLTSENVRFKNILTETRKFYEIFQDEYKKASPNLSHSTNPNPNTPSNHPSPPIPIPTQPPPNPHPTSTPNHPFAFHSHKSQSDIHSNLTNLSNLLKHLSNQATIVPDL